MDELKSLPFMNPKLDVEARVTDLFNRLTFDEKLILCAGEKDNSTAAIPRLGIPRFRMTDGPHGIAPYAFKENKVTYGANGMPIENKDATLTGIATYFPTGIQMASTWNPDLITEFGKAVGEEMRAIGWHMLLGPAFNICRSPMCGRTFEYYTEDPYLSGEMAASAVKGIQSRRISACIKHYVANNFETNRFKVNIVVSRRTLEEIYLAGFKRCVKKADPWAAMSSYNKINGTYVSEHKEILRTFLKDEWGFSGVVVSDWGATNHCTGIKGLVEAGLDIEMGSRNRYNIEMMKQMKAANEFPDAYFDDNIKRILRAMIRTGCFDDPASLPKGSLNTDAHHQVARKIAEEGMVLLKNEDNILPLDITKVKKIALFGKHADTKFGRFKLGGGSSTVYPPYEITIRQGLTEKCAGKIEIVQNPAEADVAIVCVGLEHSHDFKGGDHEGSDRLRYSLGILPQKLIKSTLAKNKNTIVVCVNGSPFGFNEVAGKVPVILEAWYGGMEIGHAVADILFGDVNPSGKLPVSWPKRKKDIPSTLSFWNTIIPVKEVRYDEGIFVGYRHYDTRNVEPEFCFGHGLSYTAFEYSGLKLSAPKMNATGSIIVQFEIQNTGTRAGKEIAQLYIQDVQASVPRPVKELKGFQKVNLAPGEKTTVKLELKPEDLAFFDEHTKSWKTEPGEFKVLIGSSSRDIRLEAVFQFQ
jgi:beta-glucosidase